MTTQTKATVYIAVLIALLAALIVWMLSMRDKCLESHCAHGSPTWFARDTTCICAEVPR